ncbi:MAG: hypothetical protein PSV23_00570 [Brevundimonas sp.]|uniref:hypothetical protein n=1 Tax=Brevundimonas sp. TaxID=1871086 RepID=UPI002487362D|nr:hypothetical protein [Brevundimonas sp.]MDI1325279.1 hypothetical protein [Brevundimonas sp.]
MAQTFSRYEQAVETIRLLGLDAVDIEQQFRRAVFNLFIRNQTATPSNVYGPGSRTTAASQPDTTSESTPAEKFAERVAAIS